MPDLRAYSYAGPSAAVVTNMRGTDTASLGLAGIAATAVNMVAVSSKDGLTGNNAINAGTAIRLTCLQVSRLGIALRSARLAARTR